jgi:hypothetical protein
MTERRRPGPLPTFGLAAATFLMILTLLASQVRAGKDPAIGTAKPPPAKQVVVVVKRIERKVIVEVPAGSAAPATRPAAPAASAPAAPAPAAPAPVLATRSS